MWVQGLSAAECRACAIRRVLTVSAGVHTTEAAIAATLLAKRCTGAPFGNPAATSAVFTSS